MCVCTYVSWTPRSSKLFLFVTLLLCAWRYVRLYACMYTIRTCIKPKIYEFDLRSVLLQVSCVKFLMESRETHNLIGSCDAAGLTIMHYAVVGGNPDMMDLLISKVYTI